MRLFKMEEAEYESTKKSSLRIDDTSENIENGVFHLSTTNQVLKINDNNNFYKSLATAKNDLVRKLRERKWKKL